MLHHLDPPHVHVSSAYLLATVRRWSYKSSSTPNQRDTVIRPVAHEVTAISFGSPCLPKPETRRGGFPWSLATAPDPLCKGDLACHHRPACGPWGNVCWLVEQAILYTHDMDLLCILSA